MATPQGKTRTNYFKVNDGNKFISLLERMVTDSGDAVNMMQNDKGEVGFCCNAVIYGVKPEGITDKQIETIKKGLFMDGMEECSEFVGMDVSSWDKDSIDNAMDETIAQMPEEDLKKYLDQYDSGDIDYEGMWDEMVKEIQSLLQPGHACIMTDIKWEKLVSLEASVLIVTDRESNLINLNDEGLNHARAMLRNNEYSPQTTY